MNIPHPLKKLMAALQVRRSDPQQGGSFNLFSQVAGVVVSHEDAEKVAAVWACMDVIASAMSSSDWNVYAGLRHGANKEHLGSDGLQYILNTRMNPEMTAQAGKRALVLAAVGWKDGYAEIERDMAGRIVALWPIHPKRVDPRRDPQGRLFYQITQEWGGGTVDIDPEDMFIIRGASLFGFSGDDTVNKAVQSIATAIAQDQYAAGFFGNGAQMGTIFTYKGKMGDNERKRVEDQIKKRHQGVRNAFRFGLFDGGGEWKVESLGADAEKSQLVAAKHLSIEDICRWFRVPPHKIAHLLRATNNNIEHQGLEFSRDTLRPWKMEIEQEADYKLIPYRGPKKFVEIDLDWAEQGDYKSRAEAYQVLRNIGVFSANDVLRKLGENTIGSEGDIRIVQGANVRLEDVGAAYEKPAPDPEEPDAEMAQAWLGSAFARIASMVENRREQHKGKPDADKLAFRDGVAYVDQALKDVIPVMNRYWPGSEDMIRSKAMAVIRGDDPTVCAESCVMKMRDNVADQVAQAVVEMREMRAALDRQRVVITNSIQTPEVRVEGSTINVPEREVNVTVERSSVSVDAPVVNVAVPERPVSVNVEAPEITVEAPVVNMPAQPVNVTVEPSNVTVGAPVIHNAAPVVNLAEREVTVNLPETVVNVTLPEQQAPVVNVEAPVVNVAAPEVRIEPPKVDVKVENKVPPANVTVSLPKRESETDISRDADGRITYTRTVERDID